MGRRAEVEVAPRTQHGVPSLAEVSECGDRASQRLTELANLPLEAGLRAAASSLSRPTSVPIVQATASLVLMLNIPAARVAPRRAGRRAELHDRQPADAAKLRSPNASLPQTPVSGRANPADFCAVESGVYGARFLQVFGTGLEGEGSWAGVPVSVVGDDTSKALRGTRRPRLQSKRWQRRERRNRQSTTATA